MPKKPKRPKRYLSKLAGRIKEKYDTQGNFAFAINKSPTYVNSRLCLVTDITASEIAQWCDMLEIRSDEIRDYFMPDWVPKADRIVPSGKARARFDHTTGQIVCNAYARNGRGQQL